LVEKDSLMPRTPFGTLDIILNPIGVISRMNMGQIFEMYCGLISKILANKILDMTKNQAADFVSKVYSHLDISTNKATTQLLEKGLKNLSDSQYKLMIETIKRSGFFPLIIPPFKSPGNKGIKLALSAVGAKPGYKLKLPEFNTETESDVPIGYMYISKLEHLAEMKLHGRSTGPTTGQTAQPTAGKRKEGGQRLGELDSYTFISYNCINVLAEMMGPLSDDYKTRDEIIADIVQNGSAEYREAKISPARDLLNSYFISLMLER